MKEKHVGNDSESKQHFLQHKGNHSNNKETYTDTSKSTGRKVGFAAIFAGIIRRGALPEETFIHTAEMTIMREIQKKRGNKKGSIYRLAEFNAGYPEQQREPSNINSDI